MSSRKLALACRSHCNFKPGPSDGCPRPEKIRLTQDKEAEKAKGFTRVISANATNGVNFRPQILALDAEAIVLKEMRCMKGPQRVLEAGMAGKTPR